MLLILQEHNKTSQTRETGEIEKKKKKKSWKKKKKSKKKSQQVF